MGNQVENRNCLYEFLKTSSTMKVKIEGMSSDELGDNLRGNNGFLKQIFTFSKYMESFIIRVEAINECVSKMIEAPNWRVREEFDKWLRRSDTIASCTDIIRAFVEKSIIKRKILNLFATAAIKIKDPIPFVEETIAWAEDG